MFDTGVIERIDSREGLAYKLQWFLDPAHLYCHVLDLSVKYLAMSNRPFSNWNKPKPKVLPTIDRDLSSFATVLTISSDMEKTFIIQLMAFDCLPIQLKWIFTNSSLTVFCYEWTHAYLMIQHMYGGQFHPDMQDDWFGMDHKNFVAGITM